MSIVDLSKKLGISVSTVSKALNNYSDVSAKTREMVKKAARESGYQPSSSARSLRRRGTERIGLINPTAAMTYWVTEMTSDYFMRFLKGAGKAAEQREYNLMLYTAHSMEKPHTVKKIAFSREVDGLIVMGGWNILPAVKELAGTGIPFILMGRRPPHENISYITFDYRLGASLATEHLILRGHEKIAYIGQEVDPENETRMGGYLDALGKHGIPFDPELVVSAPYEEGGGRPAMAELLSRKKKFTAALFYCDNIFFDGLPLLQEQGITVPEDLAVVGFDDTDRGRLVEPGLSSIHMPLEAIGSRAVELLLESIEAKGEKVFQETMPVSLVVRDSSGREP